MYDIMLDIAAPIQKIGIKDMIKTVTQEAEKTPTTTAEGIITIAKAMEVKLNRVKNKNEEALKKKSENATTT